MSFYSALEQLRSETVFQISDKECQYTSANAVLKVLSTKALKKINQRYRERFKITVCIFQETVFFFLLAER